ncbi:YbaB/EbfC family nucleoid-associated protein [Methyloceanibacter sp. wino2]|uniref:YbaB/EbfC family nucleoid-associated protein n=1 Tax=Methyloceanibacter sp. wino2 TaxID=2170729 RepID=UPI00352EA090
MDMMKQAQQLQGKMQDMQTEMESLTCEGRAGAGMVTVTLNGKGEMKAVAIDPSMLKPEETEILEDLIITAHADAKLKVEEAMKEKMASLTGGLPIPPASNSSSPRQHTKTAKTRAGGTICRIAASQRHHVAAHCLVYDSFIPALNGSHPSRWRTNARFLGVRASRIESHTGGRDVQTSASQNIARTKNEDRT